MIEPDAPTTARPSRAKAAVVGITLLGLLTAGVGLLAGGDDQGDRLALVTGAGGKAGFQSERLAAPTAAGAADSAMPIYPGYSGIGYSGIEYRVEGRLPDLGSQGAAWKIRGRELGRAAAARLSEALGLQGEPTLRDGAWVLETADGNFNAYFDGSTWSLNFHRTPAGAGPAAGDMTAADAERVARSVLDRMGALEGEWRVQTSESEFAISVACASPGFVGDPGELKKLEAEKVARSSEAQGSGGGGSVSNSSPISAADSPVASPPSNDVIVDSCLRTEPAPVSKGLAVSFFPVLDGVRTDWQGWSMLIRADERIENLYGMWATYERAGDFKLRSVDAALEELRSGGDSRPIPMTAESPIAIEPDMGAPTPAVGAAEPAIGVDSAIGEEPAVGVDPAIGAPEPVIDPARPAIAPCPMGAETKKEMMMIYPEPCSAPQVVTITGVERSLIPMGVYTGGQERLHLVPAYRFTGTFEGGEAYETSVLALHPDAIAPPPVPDPAVGKTEPGRPPSPETPVQGGVGGGGTSGSGVIAPDYPQPTETEIPAKG